MKNIEGFSKVKSYYWDDIDEEDRIESMWVSPSGSNYKIENIPFFIKEFAFGDVVSVKTIDDELFIDELIDESGNSAIQILFLDKSIIAKTREELKNMGCDSELNEKSSLIAVNVPPIVNYQNDIKPYLIDGFNNELWDYQEACLSTIHSEND